MNEAAQGVPCDVCAGQMAAAISRLRPSSPQRLELEEAPAGIYTAKGLTRHLRERHGLQSVVEVG